MMVSATVLWLAAFQNAPAPQPAWVEGEIGYRVTIIPDGSPGARAGLRAGDILAEPGPLPSRLRGAPEGGSVDIPLFRLDAQYHYARQTLRIAFKAGEAHRLGTTGDFGFLIAGVKADSPGAKAGLRIHDFVPKIDETFVHAPGDMALVATGRAVQVTRPKGKGEFEALVLNGGGQ